MALSVDDLVKIQNAILLGKPDPIGTPQSAKAYAEMKAEIDSKAGQVDILRDDRIRF